MAFPDLTMAFQSGLQYFLADGAESYIINTLHAHHHKDKKFQYKKNIAWR